MFRLLIILTILLPIVSCRKTEYEKFATQYNKEKFDEFTNFEIFVRDFDRSSDPIIGVIPLTRSNKQIYCVTIQKKSGRVKKSNYDLLLDKKIVDTLTMNHLALMFLKYDVYQLKVDSNRDVSVKLFNESKEFLIKHGDESRVNKNCKRVKDSWYLCQ